MHANVLHARVWRTQEKGNQAGRQTLHEQVWRQRLYSVYCMVIHLPGVLFRNFGRIWEKLNSVAAITLAGTVRTFRVSPAPRGSRPCE